MNKIQVICKCKDEKTLDDFWQMRNDYPDFARQYNWDEFDLWKKDTQNA